MTYCIRRTFGCLTFAAMLTLGGATQPPAANPVEQPALDSVVRTEVRLRKLHLVRPDLIPYPIAYEVVC